MARFLKYSVLIISLIANLFFGWNYFQDNQVVKVVDGDTFQLKSGKRVRLMGVDAPEYDRCGGQEAKQRLTELIEGKNVSLKEEVTEAFGRSLALVYSDGRLINEIILQEGWGRPDYRKNSQRDLLTAAFHEAQSQKLGIFSDKCQQNTAKDKCVIKGNIDPASYAKFYHLPGCKHYQQTVVDLSRGEQWFCSEKEAQAAGFVKADGCE